MTCYIYFAIIVHLFHVLYSLEKTGWNYINLQCRDNYNKPVDWWYLYKPPNEYFPYIPDKPFAYITPDTNGQWLLSKKHLAASSLLSHTFSPVFRPTYTEYLAIVKYDKRVGTGLEQDTSVFGVLMADEMGGIWITHSVPGFPDVNRDRLTIPGNQSASGHIFMCMSLDLITLNRVAALIQRTIPNFVTVKIPEGLKKFLPKLTYINQPSLHLVDGGKHSTSTTITTREKTIQIFIAIRTPRDKHCLYREFAAARNLVLDVYEHRNHKKNICEKNYSVRHIDSISIKDLENVYYISNKTDRTGFAVGKTHNGSQRYNMPKETGTNNTDSTQHWACINSVDVERKTGNEALIVCTNDYHLWRSFDTLKVKEPKC